MEKHPTPPAPPCIKTFFPFKSCGLSPAHPTLEVVSQYEKAFNHAKSLGLGVNAGHDLDLNNLELFLSKVPADEVSIGHALISDALINGLEVVTKQFLDLCK